MTRPRITHVVFYFFLFFWLCYFGSLWGRQLSITPKGMIAGSDRTWADGAAHLSYISAFLERGFFLPEHPLYKGVVFSYPPISDWLTAALVFCGLSLPFAFNAVGFGLSMLTVGLLYIFYFQFTHKNSLASVLSSFLFLWSGGLGFLLPIFFKVSSPGSLTRLTELPNFGIRFINTIDAELLPQRAFLLGLPLGLLLLLTLLKLWQKKPQKPAALLSVGLLSGILPLAHPHTFIAMSLVVFWTTLYFLVQEKKSFYRALYVVIPFFILGGLLTLYQTRGLGQHFFWIKWGWLAHDFQLGWLGFWVANWGFWLPLAVVGFIKSTRVSRLFLVPFLLLFFVANVIVFQPYDWDNSKLFTWVQLAFSGVGGWLLAAIWHKKSYFKKILVILFFCFATISGAHDSLQLLDYPTTSIQLFDQEELVAADWVKKNTELNAVFLTSDTHRHFIPALAGRQILMGYRGWMWSYGIDYSQREADVLEMFSGSDTGKLLLKDYGVNYVVIGPAEKDAFYKANESFFQKEFQEVFKTQQTAIYRITQSESRD